MESELNDCIPRIEYRPSREDFERIQARIRCYQYCPFAKDGIPGGVLQDILASVRGDRVLSTYDFVDNISRCGRFGWQVKATKESTPVTWKRAKLPSKERLIAESKKNSSGLQALGDAIIKFCNDHAAQSMARYGLDEIWLARLIAFDDGRSLYYERRLCTKSQPEIFDPREYRWKWSTPKETKLESKEQLQALHGCNLQGRKCWAWHGLGENQLHFSGERAWWPAEGAALRGASELAIWFKMPGHRHRMDWGSFSDAIAKAVVTRERPRDSSE